MPALRLRSGQAPAGIPGEQAAACGYSAWIPAFAGMTQHSSTPHNHRDRLLVRQVILFFFDFFFDIQPRLSYKRRVYVYLRCEGGCQRTKKGGKRASADSQGRTSR